MPIISINGEIGSGKDTVAKLIQRQSLIKLVEVGEISAQLVPKLSDIDNWSIGYSQWKVKKYATKLKQVVNIFTGISMEDLEKQEVKNLVLPECWNRWRVWILGGLDSKIFATKEEAETHLAIKGMPGSVVEQPITVRMLLQEIGTEAFRNIIHPNIHVNGLYNDYVKVRQKVEDEEYAEIDPSWIVSDLRFPNEFNGGNKHGSINIRVNRPRKGKVWIPNDPSKHLSETALDDYFLEGKFHAVITNDSNLIDLEQNVEDVLNRFNLL